LIIGEALIESPATFNRIQEYGLHEGLNFTPRAAGDKISLLASVCAYDILEAAKTMKGIVTVLGTDSVGIIAKICMYLSERNVNVLDIAQTIVGGYFNMMMVVDLNGASEPLASMVNGLETLGRDIGVVVKLQHEDIFNAMHRI
jgi:ACT domain-containing protein